MTMLLTGRQVRGAGIGDDRESRFPRLAADSPLTVSSASEACAAVGSSAHLIIDPEAIGANTRLFAARTRGAVMAVVKADGFGHGAGLVAAAALANGATWVGVTSLAEALALRRAGVLAPVLTWLDPVDADFSVAIGLDVDVAVPSLEHLAAVAAAAAAVRRQARVHLHVDCGMARDGAPPWLWRELCERASALRRGGLGQGRGRDGALGVRRRPGRSLQRARPGAVLLGG